MSTKIKNEYGTITIENDVILRIAGYTALEISGVAGMASKNVKDGIVQLLRRDNFAKGVQFAYNGSSIVISLHIIVEYGINISSVAESVIDAVKAKLDEAVGIPIEQINVYVDGISVDNQKKA